MGYLKIVAEVPGEQALTTLPDSKCDLMKKSAVDSAGLGLEENE